MHHWLKDISAVKTPIADQELSKRVCLRALNIVYAALITIALPSTIWFHLIVDFKPQAMVFVLFAGAYFPCAIGWFPKNINKRLLFAFSVGPILAIATNSFWSFEIQPGLYVMTTFILCSYIAYGFSGFLKYWALTTTFMVSANLALGVPYPSQISTIIVSVSTWAAVCIASITLFHYLITALLDKTHNLEVNAKQLAEREAQARDLSDSMARMFRVISHELRTPAAAISMIASGDDDPCIAVRDIQTVSEHLLYVIDDLRMAVSPDSTIQLDIRPVSLKALRDSIEQQMLLIASAAGVNLRIEFERDETAFLTDAYRVRTIVSNLVRNAILHSGGNRIRVKLTNMFETDLPRLLVEVSDDGTGIAPEDRARIFKLFERGNTSAGGTGVGLYLANQWTNSLGGTLSLSESDSLGGACFTAEVPVQISGAGSAESKSDISIKEARSWATGKSVLVIEDDADLRRLTKRMLEHQFKMDVKISADALEALQIMEVNQFDIILTDYFMPRMDGDELIKLIRKAHPKLPVIAATAATIGGEIDELISAGADYVIPKPLSVEKFENALIQITERYNLGN